jgi:hypothetical protein
MLEATIGLNEIEDEDETETADEDAAAEDGPFTRNDLTFLKSLRITTEEHTIGDATDGDNPST